MKKVPLVIGLGTVLVLALAPALVLASNTTVAAASLAALQSRSTIYGSVYGIDRRPVADVYVELLDDFNASIRQQKTDASGRFQFAGLFDGRYILKIHTGNTGYLEHTQQVVISSISSVSGNQTGGRSSGSDNQHVDIALRLDARGFTGPFSTAPMVIFVQDVPPAAKRNYDEGVAFLREKKDEQAFAKLKAALEVFPDYYAALDRLGGEYANRGVTDKGKNPEYLQAGLVLLTKATQVNPRGFSSMFGLGWTEYHLGMHTEAIEHLEKATALYGKDPDPYRYQGMAYRRAKMLDKAEQALKKADQVANGKVADIHWELANVYNDQKRYGEAADQIELYLKSAPKGEDPAKIKDLIKRLREKAK